MQLIQNDQEFLLVCEAASGSSEAGGSWRFVLEHLDGQPYLEAQDHEPGDANRLSLWAVVRGLEALPGPAAVTMLTSSRYVIRSISESLPRWKAAGFECEHFGQRLPVSNADLWRRIDHALDIHAVSACCVAAAPRVDRRIRLASSDGDLREGAWRGSESWRGGESWRGNEQGAGVSARVSDGLRRWLFAQCQAATGGRLGADAPRCAVA